MTSIKDICDLLIKTKQNFKCPPELNEILNDINPDEDNIIDVINMKLEFTIPPKVQAQIRLPMYNKDNNKISYTIKITAEDNSYITQDIDKDDYFTLSNIKEEECKYTVEIIEANDIYHFGYNGEILFEDPQFSAFYNSFINNKSKFKLSSIPCVELKNENDNIFKTWEGAEFLTRVKDWGNNLKIKDFTCAFYFCTNLISVPFNLPSGVRKMNWMFAFASSFETDLSKWDVSKVLYMDGMFCSANKFNYTTIKDWNISTVKKMNDLIYFTNGYSKQNLYYHK
jgi:surface protein